jgi:hypothetical protein
MPTMLLTISGLLWVAPSQETVFQIPAGKAKMGVAAKPPFSKVQFSRQTKTFRRLHSDLGQQQFHSLRKKLRKLFFLIGR